MLILDLKPLLFVLLALLGAALGLAAWLSRRTARSRPTGDPALLPALDAAPFGLLTLDEETLTYANDYARAFLRLPAILGPLPDADWAPLLAADRDAARRDGAGRYRNVTFASGRTARWWVTPAAAGGVDAVFLLDVTAQQRAEGAARALVNDLSHELRTPIATLLTHLEILGLDDLGEGVREQSLALSRAETQRMTRLVEDMLELGRLETARELPRRPLDLLALVEEVVLQVTPRSAERDIELSLDAETPLPRVEGNADRLRQLFLNLLDNALKYSRRGDEVTLHLRATEGGVACSICDTGPGISPEHLPYVTRRFYRAAPRSVEGSGLGLALAAEVARRHGGELELESPVQGGEGTCARFVLPEAGA
jgi:two-component system phosphate regulon sensor histidine kinase PhoR